MLNDRRSAVRILKETIRNDTKSWNGNEWRIFVGSWKLVACWNLVPRRIKCATCVEFQMGTMWICFVECRTSSWKSWNLWNDVGIFFFLPQLKVGRLCGVLEVDAHGNCHRGLRIQALCVEERDKRGVEGVGCEWRGWRGGEGRGMPAEWNRQVQPCVSSQVKATGVRMRSPSFNLAARFHDNELMMHQRQGDEVPHNSW